MLSYPLFSEINLPHERLVEALVALETDLAVDGIAVETQLLDCGVALWAISTVVPLTQMNRILVELHTTFVIEDDPTEITGCGCGRHNSTLKILKTFIKFAIFFV